MWVCRAHCRVWEKVDKRPKVVNRCTLETGKATLRLCVDALYANLRSKFEEFA